MRSLWTLFALAHAIYMAPFSISNAAGADACPDITARIDENAVCNPNGAKTKDCDAKYPIASNNWIACYRAVSTCRTEVFEQNKAIYARNALAYKCRLPAAAPITARVQPDASAADCGREFDACYKGCPNNLSNGCLLECSKRNDACLKTVEARGRAERELRQCTMLPVDAPQIGNAIAGAWTKRRAAINDGIKTLHQLREDIESDARWTVGAPGSARELSIYLAQVTKTTTDLIENLGGFSSEKSARAVKEIYEEIQRGRRAVEIVTQDAQKVAVNMMLDAASDVNPVARGVKTIKDLAESIIEMTQTPEELKSAREAIKRQLDGIDAQIASMQRRLDQATQNDEPMKIAALLDSYRSVHQMCSAATPAVAKP